MCCSKKFHLEITFLTSSFGETKTNSICHMKHTHSLGFLPHNPSIIIQLMTAVTLSLQTSNHLIATKQTQLQTHSPSHSHTFPFTHIPIPSHSHFTHISEERSV